MPEKDEAIKLTARIKQPIMSSFQLKFRIQIALILRFAQPRATHLLLCGVLVCASTITGLSRTGFTQSTEALHQRTTHVALLNNVVIPSNEGQLHSVSFRYSFPRQDFIRISGLGKMHPTGELAYLTPDTEVRFFDMGGGLLEAVDLKDATQVMGGSSTDTPARSEFADNFRLGFWKQKSPFSVHAMKVLNQQFTSGLLPTITDANGENVLITAYHPLSGLPEDLFGEVAVLVSHADKYANEELSFRVRWNAREKRKLTRWRTPISEPTKQAAEAFVSKLLAALQSAAEATR
jgi:hypothetical protein